MEFPLGRKTTKSALSLALKLVAFSEVGIYKREQESMKERNHALDQEKMITAKKKKERKHALDQESRIQEKTIATKKKDERKWTPQFRIQQLASFF